MVTDEPPQPEETADKDIQDEYSEIFKTFWYSMTKNIPRGHHVASKTCFTLSWKKMHPESETLYFVEL